MIRKSITITIGVFVLLGCSCSKKQAAADNDRNRKATNGHESTFRAEIYRTIDDVSVLKILSSTELELSEGSDHFICQYTREPSGLRVTMEVFGTKKAVYFETIPDGFRDEQGSFFFRPDRYDHIMAQILAARKQKANNNRLFEACGSGDLEAAKTALQDGAELTATNLQGGTLLHVAVAAGNPEVVQLLIEKGANPNARSPGLVTPLHVAADTGGQHGFVRIERKPGHDQIVSMLLRAQVDINAPVEEGFTPLMLTLFRGNDEATKLLVVAGADRMVVSREGKTVFDYVAGDRTKLSLLRTPAESKLFEQSRTVIKTIGSFQPSDVNLHGDELKSDDKALTTIPANGISLTDVGIHFKTILGTPMILYYDSIKTELGCESDWRGHYVSFSSYDLVAFKSVDQRNAFYTALTNALSGWKKRFEGIW